MTRRRPALAVAMAAALLATTACTASPRREAPVPIISEGPTAPAPAPADDSCNPRASLRPAGQMPAPGRMSPGTFLAEIQKRGRLILGTSQDKLLFSSRNPFTGRIEGFDVDMGRQVAKAIFGDPDKIEIRVVPSAERVDWIRDGKVDLVISTMTANCARWRDVDFSTTYYESGQRVLVAKDSIVRSIDDLDRQKVCSASGSTSLENIAKERGGPIPVGKPTFGECLVAFQQNEVVAISTDDTILAGLAAQDPYAKVVGDPFTEEPYGIAVSKDHPELTRFVNQVLEQIRRDGTWAATYTRWLRGTAPRPPAAQYQ